jgi:hypothetical protein
MAIIPYHSSALYSVETANKLLVGRPGSIARKTGAIVSHQLQELNYLLSAPHLRESQLQSFFERNDSFFRMLGYKNVYPHVILEKYVGNTLIPDFILEPFDEEWCDILDLKLPQQSVFVGGRDRKDFSHSVHQLRAQLREYSAYFDDEKLAKRVKDRYGIKVYKPKLIGVIGKHIDHADDRQIRRAMTQDPSFRVITFDELVALAKHRILT